ncbi:MAG: YggS family pyridoxal phosphate-dependent enzyme [Propionibacteriaceae bacterium]|nr:YggS family pyridoxal phosphate-dependent enzyme [Propionibacteriaceae bacterium]
MTETTIAENLARIRQEIEKACTDAGRQVDEVELLPVTKAHPVSVISEAVKAGCKNFGENRVQDMVAKATELDDFISWVMIGHLQRNKVRAACTVMRQLQSLDSIELAQALETEYSTKYHRGGLDLLVQVNTSQETTKHGVAVDEVLEFAEALKAFPHLNPTGLMTVAHPDPALADKCFKTMATLQRQLRDRDGGGWDELSMGMSSDFVSAIAHGSTCIRIGTAIFGHRLVAGGAEPPDPSKET